MARASRPLLDGIDRLVVDGTNLLHVLRDDGGPPAAAIGRIRAAIPSSVEIDLVFDGPKQAAAGRVAQRMTVRYAGRRTADEVLIGLMEILGTADVPVAVLAVTDDGALRARLARLGARTAGTSWLVGRLDRPKLASAAPGNSAPPRPPLAPAAEIEESRPGWRPGRGATTKRGPARRAPRRARP